MLARIHGLVIAEERDAALADIPEHKRHEWRPIEGAWPAFDPRIETIAGPEMRIEPARVVRTWVVTPRPLDIVQDELKARVDADAEKRRLSYITGGAGQAMEYQRVAAEAAALFQGHPGPFPMLQASVDAGEGETLEQVAAVVAQRDTQWLLIGAQIRAVRLAAKLAIDAAADVHAARDAFDAIQWP